MIDLYKKIYRDSKVDFIMPLSLRIIKEASEHNIDYKSLHIADLYSIIYSIRIDNAKQYLQQKQKQKMDSAGISEIRKATVDDFDRL